MDTVTIVSIALLPLGLYIYTVLAAHTMFPTIHDAHILLLIAHPDDEAMFFAPTVLALTNPSLNNRLKILCLSTGDADGIGEVRKKELVKSAVMLGVRSNDVVVLDDDELKDSPHPWPSSKINAVLTAFLIPKPTSANPSPRPHCDAILTFDAAGVSGHPNHGSCYAGALAFLSSLSGSSSSTTSSSSQSSIYASSSAQDAPAIPKANSTPIALYTLHSTSMLRKYLSILDAPIAVLLCMLRLAICSSARQDYFSPRAKSKAKKSGGAGAMERARAVDPAARLVEELPAWLLTVSGPGGYRKGQRAMYAAHKSQMRWFRWGWITIGRYMLINEVRRVV